MKITNLGTKFLGTKKQEREYLNALNAEALRVAIISKYKRGVK